MAASAWYSYTPAASGTLLVLARALPERALAVYSGTSLTDLSELASGSGWSPPLMFAAEAGTTYYVQVGTGGPHAPGRPRGAGHDRAAAAALGELLAPPLLLQPLDLRRRAVLRHSYDPASIGFGPAQWDFGDGAVATGLLPDPSLRGRRRLHGLPDGHDARRADRNGRPGAGGPHHDVSIERIQAPNSAGVGQTKSIAVKVRGGQYAETVQVQLFKSMPGGSEELVGDPIGEVPQAHGGKSTGFDFSYTFTPEDRANGKVSFRAVVDIVGARDALPGDNQAIAPPTEVRR